MNYCDELEYHNILIESQYNRDTLRILEIESDYFLACLESGYIQNYEILTEGLIDSIGNFLKRIVDFITNIFTSFTKNSEELIKEHSEWLIRNKKVLNEIIYDGLNVECIPFWNISVNDIQNILNSFKAVMDKIPTDKTLKTQFNTMDKLESMKPFKNYKDKNLTLSDSLKKYFKVGKKDLEYVKLTGSELATKCKGEFYDYCINYGTNVLIDFKNRLNKLKSKAQEIENKLTSIIKDDEDSNIGESFSLLENALFKNTDLVYCINNEILFEKANETNSTNDNDKKKKDKEEIKTSAVNVEDEKDDKSSDNKSEHKEDISRKGANYIKNLVQINQNATTIAMTVLEERYRVYMKILRSVVKARKNKDKVDIDAKES